jgi:hypothetical protein
MAQPLDIRVAFNAERGFTVAVEGVEVNTAGMENSAILWEIMRYLVERLPDDGRMEELHTAALQMTEYFRRIPVFVPEQPRVERPNLHRHQEDLFLQQQMIDCNPPPNDEECCICHDTQPGEQWVKLHACDHTFHAKCITAWGNLTCPLCREDLSRNVRRRRG